MSDIKAIVKKIFNNTILIRIIALAIITIAFASVNFNFLSLNNMNNLMTDIGPYFIMSMGVTFVLMVGSIDLSIGAMCSLSAVITAVLLPRYGVLAFVPPIFIGILGELSMDF